MVRTASQADRDAVELSALQAKAVAGKMMNAAELARVAVRRPRRAGGVNIDGKGFATHQLQSEVQLLSLSAVWSAILQACVTTITTIAAHGVGGH